MLNLTGVECKCNFGLAPEDCLSSVTHLRLSSVRSPRMSPNIRTLYEAQLPALTHLCVYHTPVASCPDLDRIAVNLELVAFDTGASDLFAAFARYTSHMVHLRSLVVTHFGGGRPLEALVEHLPRPLDMLDLAASPALARVAPGVLASFERNDIATSRLGWIRLPRSSSTAERLEIREGQDVMELAREVASAAEARGARVEWV